MQSQESEALQARYRLACELAKAGAELAFEYYQQREALTVDHKGDDLQDVVSVADKRVEAFVKQRIQSAFPEDGFLGEESGARLPDARVLWVVDPIDGTSCFLNGLHTGACRWRSSPTANRSSAWSTTPTIGSCFTPCGAMALAQRRSDPSAPGDDGQRGRDGRRHLASRHPGGLSAVSAGAAQRRRHVYPQRLRGVDERTGRRRAG